jgi:nucleotide-binding universal stress UspA family protein
MAGHVQIYFSSVIAEVGETGCWKLHAFASNTLLYSPEFSRGIVAMQVFPSTPIFSPFSRRPVSAKILRQWCTPEVILVATNIIDELNILPHVINQAKRGPSRIILVHVPSRDRSTAQIQEIQISLDRMARRLRWLGFTCEPLVLPGPPELEIPLLVQSRCVDRVLFAFEDSPDLTKTRAPLLAELLLPLLDVPTCAIGRLVSPSSGTLIRNITLAISADSKCEVPLSFASRLAQELHAKLNLFHVFDGRAGEASPRTAQAVAARLPSPTWREAELFCPTEITVREGDASGEILKYCTSTKQDLLILCSPGDVTSQLAFRRSVSFAVIAEAHCPVFVLKSEPAIVGSVIAGSVSPEKFSAYGEEVEREPRKEAVM